MGDESCRFSDANGGGGLFVVAIDDPPTVGLMQPSQAAECAAAAAAAAGGSERSLAAEAEATTPSDGRLHACYSLAWQAGPKFALIELGTLCSGGGGCGQVSNEGPDKDEEVRSPACCIAQKGIHWRIDLSREMR